MAHDVFVSYSSHDKPVGDAVCATLESKGIRCWIAPRDVVAGMDWGEAIVSAISTAKVMVLVFSSSANQSQQIKREVYLAMNHGLVIVPVRLEDVIPEGGLEYFLGVPHWLDAFPPPLEAYLDRLAADVRAFLTKSEPVSPSAAEVDPVEAVRTSEVPPDSRDSAAPSRLSLDVKPITLSEPQLRIVEAGISTSALWADALSRTRDSIFGPVPALVASVPYLGYVLAGLWVFFVGCYSYIILGVLFGWLLWQGRRQMSACLVDGSGQRVSGRLPFMLRLTLDGQIRGGRIDTPRGRLRLERQQAEQVAAVAGAERGAFVGSLDMTVGCLRLLAAYDAHGRLVYGTT